MPFLGLRRKSPREKAIELIRNSGLDFTEEQKKELDEIVSQLPGVPGIVVGRERKKSPLEKAGFTFVPDEPGTKKKFEPLERLGMEKVETPESEKSILRRAAEAAGYGIKRQAKGIATGATGTVASAMRFVGIAEKDVIGSGILDDIANKVREISKEASPPAPQNDFERWADGYMQGLGSIAVFLPAGGLSTMALASKFAPALARRLGVSLMSLLEAATEGGAAFEEVMEETGDEDEAKKKAGVVFALNLPLNYVTNKLGIMSDKLRPTAKTIVSPLLEASQEAGQEALSQAVTGADIKKMQLGDISLKDVFFAASSGFNTGLIVSVSEQAAQKIKEKAIDNEIKRRKQIEKEGKKAAERELFEKQELERIARQQQEVEEAKKAAEDAEKAEPEPEALQPLVINVEELQRIKREREAKEKPVEVKEEEKEPVPVKRLEDIALTEEKKTPRVSVKKENETKTGADYRVSILETNRYAADKVEKFIKSIGGEFDIKSGEFVVKNTSVPVDKIIESGAFDFRSTDVSEKEHFSIEDRGVGIERYKIKTKTDEAKSAAQKIGMTPSSLETGVFWATEQQKTQLVPEIKNQLERRLVRPIREEARAQETAQAEPEQEAAPPKPAQETAPISPLPRAEQAASFKPLDHYSIQPVNMPGSPFNHKIKVKTDSARQAARNAGLKPAPLGDNLFFSQKDPRQAMLEETKKILEEKAAEQEVPEVVIEKQVRDDEIAQKLSGKKTKAKGKKAAKKRVEEDIDFVAKKQTTFDLGFLGVVPGLLRRVGDLYVTTTAKIANELAKRRLTSWVRTGKVGPLHKMLRTLEDRLEIMKQEIRDAKRTRNKRQQSIAREHKRVVPFIEETINIESERQSNHHKNVYRFRKVVEKITNNHLVNRLTKKNDVTEKDLYDVLDIMVEEDIKKSQLSPQDIKKRLRNKDVERVYYALKKALSKDATDMIHDSFLRSSIVERKDGTRGSMTEKEFRMITSLPSEKLPDHLRPFKKPVEKHNKMLAQLEKQAPFYFPHVFGNGKYSVVLEAKSPKGDRKTVFRTEASSEHEAETITEKLKEKLQDKNFVKKLRGRAGIGNEWSMLDPFYDLKTKAALEKGVFDPREINLNSILKIIEISAKRAARKEGGIVTEKAKKEARAQAEAIREEIMNTLASIGAGRHFLQRSDVAGWVGDPLLAEVVGADNAVNPIDVVNDYIVGLSGFLTKGEAAMKFASLNGKIPEFLRSDKDIQYMIEEQAETLRLNSEADIAAAKFSNVASISMLIGSISTGAFNLAGSHILGISTLTKKRFGGLSPIAAAASYEKAMIDQARNGSSQIEREVMVQMSEEGEFSQDIWRTKTNLKVGTLGSVGMSAATKAGKKAMQAAVDVGMSPLSMTERLNRRTTFLAAFRIAMKRLSKNKNLTLEQAKEEAIRFAKKANREINFSAGKLNTPRVMRKPFGKVALTLMRYPLRFTSAAIMMMKEREIKSFMLLNGLLYAVGGTEAMFPYSLADAWWREKHDETLMVAVRRFLKEDLGMDPKWALGLIAKLSGEFSKSFSGIDPGPQLEIHIPTFSNNIFMATIRRFQRAHEEIKNYGIDALSSSYFWEQVPIRGLSILSKAYRTYTRGDVDYRGRPFLDEDKESKFAKAIVVAAGGKTVTQRERRREQEAIGVGKKGFYGEYRRITKKLSRAFYENQNDVYDDAINELIDLYSKHNKRLSVDTIKKILIRTPQVKEEITYPYPKMEQ